MGGEWSSELDSTPGNSILNSSPWLAGKLTDASDMPSTGTATYNGFVKGSVYESGLFKDLNGTTSLTADFAANKMSGNLNINYASNGSSFANASLDSNVNITGAKFSGNIVDGVNSGNINGAFYGPNSAEVGGNWNLNKGSSKAAGIFTGKKIRIIMKKKILLSILTGSLLFAEPVQTINSKGFEAKSSTQVNEQAISFLKNDNPQKAYDLLSTKYNENKSVSNKTLFFTRNECKRVRFI